MDNTTTNVQGWISVKERLPEKNGKVQAFDSDSLTPEKDLMFEDGRFYFIAYGQKLDYTNHIVKWRYKTEGIIAEGLIDHGV